MSTSLHWLDLGEYLAIALAVVGSITAVTSSTWIYAIAPILISLILNAINRWRLAKSSRSQDRSLERKLDRELQQQGEVLQQEIVQARSFATALVKQTMTAQKPQPVLAAAVVSSLPPAAQQSEILDLAQKIDRHQAQTDGDDYDFGSIAVAGKL